MLLGDDALGETTVGFSSTQRDLSFTNSATTSLSGGITSGYNLSFAAASVSTAVINNRVDLVLTASVNSSFNLQSTKGVNLSLKRATNSIGETTLGESNIGAKSFNMQSLSTATFGSTKGISQSFVASSTSSLQINRRVDLTLTAVAQSSSNWVVTKGVEVRFDSQSNTTLVLVPDFDEIIGKSRADGTQQQIVRSNGERIFILEAEGQID